jgi:hypothetical protein
MNHPGQAGPREERNLARSPAGKVALGEMKKKLQKLLAATK